MHDDTSFGTPRSDASLFFLGSSRDSAITNDPGNAHRLGSVILVRHGAILFYYTMRPACAQPLVGDNCGKYAQPLVVVFYETGDDMHGVYNES